MTRAYALMTQGAHRRDWAWRPDALKLAGVMALAIGTGWAIVHYHAGDIAGSPTREARAVLAIVLVAVLLAFRRKGSRASGPGAQIAAFALSLGFFLGLVVRPPAGTPPEGHVAVLLAVGTLTFVAGSAGVGALANRRTAGFDIRHAGIDPFRSWFFLAAASLVLLAAFANLATGSTPILAGNVDAARFAGAGGVFNQLWTWILGGVEAVLVVAAARAAVHRHLAPRVALLGGASALVLIALAARSFLLIVGIAVIVAIATLGRLSVARLAVVAALGLLALGITGQLRVEHSQGQQSAWQSIRQSLAIGPSVFATVLQEVPQAVHFQHGRFLLRDLRSALPLHPFGRPEPADIWVTDSLRHRDVAVVGGTPPTLAGGLYIDFGLPGVVVGTAFLGAALALLYRWTCRRRTVGALALYAYATSYVALSAYSYVSLKPAAFAALAVCFAVDRIEGGGRRTAKESFV